MSLQELISYMLPSIAEIANRHVQCFDEMQSEIDSIMRNLGTYIPEPLVNSIVYKERDDDIEPTYTLLMGDEVSSIITVRKIDEFINSSVDDLVPIPRESEVTSDSNLEYDMPINTPLPTTDVREENFNINSPLGEYVVDFLIENVDVADLPRHLEFEDISRLDPPKSAPLNYEPLGNLDSVSRSLETSDLILEELTAVIGLDDSILTEIDDGYYDSEGDILFLEHLLIEETFFDPISAVLPKKSTLLVTPPSLLSNLA
ncbi:hypothetical protein Tco_1329630 [Tanacetum coccineum]